MLIFKKYKKFAISTDCILRLNPIGEKYLNWLNSLWKTIDLYVEKKIGYSVRK